MRRPSKKYRRLLIALGWLAIFMMGTGAGWKV